MDTRQARDYLAAAIDGLGVGEAIDDGAHISIVIDGTHVPVTLEARALVTDDDARRIANRPQQTEVTVVVADRVTAQARKILSAPRLGYLDLRGHLALRMQGVLIDADIAPVARNLAKQDALGGQAALEIACALLLGDGKGARVRTLAAEVGRAPSTTSAVLLALRNSGLLSSENRVSQPRELFWELADRWATERFYLLSAPLPSNPRDLATMKLGIDHPKDTEGWALTDTVAAAFFGAPVVATSDQRLDFFVPDIAVARRAVTLLGEASRPDAARCSVRVAPVPAACARRVTVPESHWPAAHPLFVALDLAQDTGRGREILDAWVPSGDWRRVW